MARQDTIRTTATLAGVPLGEFRTFSGGELTSADVKSATAAGQTERSRGGRKTIGNVTISRENDTRDDFELYAKWRGHADQLTIVRQPLDDDFNAKGKPLTYVCTLVRAAPGGADLGGDGLDDTELEGSVSEVKAG
jgi:hypothetical protein